MKISTEEAELLMKRLQIGVGGRGALDVAHSLIAECYGTIGSLVQERDALVKELAAAAERKELLRDATDAIGRMAEIIFMMCVIGPDGIYNDKPFTDIAGELRGASSIADVRIAIGLTPTVRAARAAEDGFDSAQSWGTDNVTTDAPPIGGSGQVQS